MISANDIDLMQVIDEPGADRRSHLRLLRKPRLPADAGRARKDAESLNATISVEANRERG